MAQALQLELVSLTLNPRGTLYKKQSLHEYTDQSGNHEAIGLFREQLSSLPWRVYRVRRIYGAKKDAHGQQRSDRKGQALRAVEHHSEEVSMDRAKQLLEEKATRIGAVLEVRRGISYLYQRKAGAEYPTREEYFVAGPAVVEVKARYGLDWFEEQWEARQKTLFY